MPALADAYGDGVRAKLAAVAADAAELGALLDAVVHAPLLAALVEVDIYLYI